MFTVADLPFRERPLLELLNLDADRDEPDHDYAGYGWARAEHLWLATEDGAPQRVDDTLVLALHTADDAEATPNDIDLEFELPDRPPVAVQASLFLAVWLPKLPIDVSSVVLALCNPHGARLFPPAIAPGPVWYAHGDVTSWIDRATREVHLVGDRWDQLAV